MHIARLTIDLNKISPDVQPELEVYEIKRENGNAYKYFVPGTMYQKKVDNSPRSVPKDCIWKPISRGNPLTRVCLWFPTELCDEPVIRSSTDYRKAVKTVLDYLSKSNHDVKAKIATAYKICLGVSPYGDC